MMAPPLKLLVPSLLLQVVHVITPAATVTTVQPPPPPPIVFIVSDDLGFNDVSFHGSNQVETPHIDEIAARGLSLMNYHVQPVCSPTRSAFILACTCLSA